MSDKQAALWFLGILQTFRGSLRLQALHYQDLGVMIAFVYMFSGSFAGYLHIAWSKIIIPEADNKH